MENKTIDELVKMIDSFMENNGGHMNITVNSEGEVSTEGELLDEVSVTTMRSLDCAAGDLACNVPTLTEGLDIDELRDYDNNDEQ